MAATLSREDLKLEQLIKVESVQVEDEEWELGGPRGFGQDTVCVQEELQCHGLATYLGSKNELPLVLESVDTGQLRSPSEKTPPVSAVAIPAASKYLRRCLGCDCSGSCRDSTVANFVVKERNVKDQITDPFYMNEATGATAIKPAVDLFVLCRSRASAEIYRAFQALESLEYPDGVLVVHVLDATNSLLAESLAQRNDFDFVRVDGQHLRLNDLEWAFELAKGDIVIGIDLDLCSSVNGMLQASSTAFAPCNNL
ncbi:hypothetical protein KC340_g14711 [Hortaea werneckii]|nr:hypothetical protein KC342_g14043 [Hortaea werneckii]KAI7064960.1 hypothetical protein KC339_g15907 [Hortaea werneckii]KAI7211690.1 hypothetical protein KC365_g14874 [Hortaea werneckii]KAI7297807.1 hypothetical protein KC340_g14711 [Hortaea werneckii]KAI7384985.1 hypothetical protein KC328_g10531 [Hortaea werneckii]